MSSLEIRVSLDIFQGWVSCTYFSLKLVTPPLFISVLCHALFLQIAGFSSLIILNTRKSYSIIQKAEVFTISSWGPDCLVLSLTVDLLSIVPSAVGLPVYPRKCWGSPPFFQGLWYPLFNLPWAEISVLLSLEVWGSSSIFPVAVGLLSFFQRLEFFLLVVWKTGGSPFIFSRVVCLLFHPLIFQVCPPLSFQMLGIFFFLF